MKGVLAYSTISHLGLITLLLGMNSPLALVAAVFHMMNHATFKASLFMAAGIVDHETGTRDLRLLSGLSRAMPITATLAVVAAASMAGVPLLNGFLSKEMFFAETMFAGHGPLLRIGLPAGATIAGMFSVAYSLRFIHQVFFGPLAEDLPRAPHEPTRWMLVPSALLVLACLLVGILPATPSGHSSPRRRESMLGASMPHYSLAVWHGLTMPLVMSAIGAQRRRRTVSAAVSSPPARAWRRPRSSIAFDARRTFDVRIVVARSVLPTACEHAVCTRGACRPSWWSSSASPSWRIAAFAARQITFAGDGAGPPIDPAFALLWLVGAACAIGAALQAKYHRLAALIMVGGSRA